MLSVQCEKEDKIIQDNKIIPRNFVRDLMLTIFRENKENGGYPTCQILSYLKIPNMKNRS